MKTTRKDLLSRYHAVRQASIAMCAPLNAEQCRIQPMPEVSPPWWNMAHTSWFFSRNVLKPFKGKRTEKDDLFDYVLNSYYTALGPGLERDRRGLMTRPTMQEVYDYRKSVDKRIEDLILHSDQSSFLKIAPIIAIGIQHEQQHQELFYSEIKYILYQTPPALRMPYKIKDKKAKRGKSPAAQFLDIPGGLHKFGNVEGGWGWDNETPVHKSYIEDFTPQNRLVTNGEYLEFMEDGGYDTQLLWLDNGWNKMREKGWKAPLYWENVDGQWQEWTLSGMQKLDLNEPVCHISFYEAEAFAAWKDARLPLEREWEHAARLHNEENGQSNFLDSGSLHPTQASHKGLSQMLGDVWEWTSSYYEPYPGYRPFEGTLVEYNEKFMDNQRVLRGGSCVSERDHIRISYRNFWPPETRFQFSGLRLAR